MDQYIVISDDNDDFVGPFTLDNAEQYCRNRAYTAIIKLTEPLKPSKTFPAMPGQNVRLVIDEECRSIYEGKLREARWCPASGCWDLTIGNVTIEYYENDPSMSLIVNEIIIVNDGPSPWKV